MAVKKMLTITGKSGPIAVTGDSTFVHVTETGEIDAPQSGRVRPTGIFLSGDNTRIVVDDGGKIIASGGGIRTFGTGDYIEANGSIVATDGVGITSLLSNAKIIVNGDITALLANVIINSGSTVTIGEDANLTGFDTAARDAIQAFGSGIAIKNAGTLHGTILIAGSGSAPDSLNTVANAGTITEAANDHVAIRNISNTGASSDATVVNAAFGTINGNIDLSGKLYNADTLQNSGHINGDVFLGGGATILDIKGGSISGAVTMQGVVNTAIWHHNAGIYDIVFDAPGQSFVVNDTREGSPDGTVTIKLPSIADASTSTFKFANLTDNIIYASPGNSAPLNGTAGHDIFVGQAGNTIVTNGGGDTIIFEKGFGNVAVFGFAAGSAPKHDVIAIEHAGITSFDQLKSLGDIAAKGADVVITLDPADTLTLHNTALASLRAADFHFV